MSAPTDTSGSWLGALAATSEMGALVAAFDWSSTSLGPIEEWPTALKIAVRACLSTRFPMLVVWGPELIKIYNDGYRPLLGDEKHPGALGAPVADVWPEVWDTIGPMFDLVISTGASTWDEDQRLVLHRNGFPEECFFTYSYSPLYDGDDVVRGVIDIVTETTTSVVANRRLECLADLSASLLAAGTPKQLCVRAMRALSRWTDCVPSAQIFLRTDAGLVPVASSDGAVMLGAPPVDGTLRPPAPGEPGDTSDVVLSVGGERDEALAVIVAKLNPQRPFDAGYREFLNLLGQLIGASLDGAQQHADEVDEHRSVSDVLQQAMLEPAATHPTVAVRYVPAVDKLAVGGDWYDAIDLPGDRRALVVGDCVGHGLSAAAAMSQLRAASRAMLIQGLGPGQMLGELSRYSTSVDGAFGATAACVIVDRRRSTLTFARAGHLPPLVAGAGGSRWLDDVVSPPLGVVPDRTVPEATVPVGHGEVVVMCSDGLVERRDEALDAGLDRLCRTVSAHLDEDVQDLADHLLAEMVGRAPTDDVVVVVKRLPAPEGDPGDSGDAAT